MFGQCAEFRIEVRQNIVDREAMHIDFQLTRFQTR
ncbi:hypothetical protein D046_6198A, partial [Vibrio parahaemolyticus V-223/04]